MTARPVFDAHWLLGLEKYIQIFLSNTIIVTNGKVLFSSLVASEITENQWSNIFLSTHQQ
jgi:hypothetical protein